MAYQFKSQTEIVGSMPKISNLTLSNDSKLCLTYVPNFNKIHVLN